GLGVSIPGTRPVRLAAPGPTRDASVRGRLRRGGAVRFRGTGTAVVARLAGLHRLGAADSFVGRRGADDVAGVLPVRVPAGPCGIQRARGTDDRSGTFARTVATQCVLAAVVAAGTTGNRRRAGTRTHGDTGRLRHRVGLRIRRPHDGDLPGLVRDV